MHTLHKLNENHIEKLKCIKNGGNFPSFLIPAVVVMAPVVLEEWDLVDMGCEAIEMELDFVPVAPL